MKPLSTYPLIILLWLLAGVSAQANIALEAADPAQVAAQYGKLPMSFEANRGQSDPAVRFLSRGAGYALFITPTEAVFSLRKGGAKAGGEAGTSRPSLHTSPSHTEWGHRSHALRGNAAPDAPASPYAAPERDRMYSHAERPSLYTSAFKPVISLVPNLQLGNSVLEAPASRLAKLELRVPGSQAGAWEPANSPFSKGGTGLPYVSGEMCAEHGDDKSPASGVAGTSEKVRTAHPTVGADLSAQPAQRADGTADETLAVRMQLVGANPKASVAGLDELPGKVNYLRGNDPKRWQTGIATYGKVKLNGVYNGVDLVYYGNGRQLEYDFIVAPGADPKAIRLNFSGTDNARLDATGDLLLHTKGGELRLQKPVVYQTVGGRKQNVDGRFVLHNLPLPQGEGRGEGKHKSRQIGFQVAAYDVAQALVIDPVLVYSSYLGGSGLDWARGVAVDSAGNAYVTGVTSSPNFPTVNAKYPNLRGHYDAFVTKINASGSQILYSTYLGGSGGNGSEGRGIAVDSKGNAHVTGITDCFDFPVVNAKYPNIPSFNAHAFVTKLNATGSQLLYSTYLGGSNFDWAYAIGLDSIGNAYVTGMTASPDFPTVNAKYPQYSGGVDVFLTKFSSTGSQVLYSTYLGGLNDDTAQALAIDSAGNAYVTGHTKSNDFPTVNAKYPDYGGKGDAFVTKFNANGSQVLYSTYLGGSNNENWNGNTFNGPQERTGLTVDSAGNAYVTGTTNSSDFPVVDAKYPNFGGYFDAFVTKFNASGSQVLYSTYLGGSGGELGNSIVVDSTGNAYVTGQTSSSDFPTVNAKYPALLVGSDAFVTQFNANGSQVLYSTYLGGSGSYDAGNGIAVDSAGNAYVTGVTDSTDFPTHANDTSIVSFDSSYNGGGTDAFVAKFSTYAISAIKKGTGTGTVSSNPPGIACGTQCFKAFPPGKKVTLSAAPDANSRFVRWEGDCAGTQTGCTLTINEGKRVTAVFDSTQPLNAQPLIDSLGKLKTQMLAKVDSDLEITARAFGDSKYLRRSLVWSDWTGTLLDLASGTLSVIATVIDAVNEVRSTLMNGFVAADSQYKLMTWTHTAFSLYESLTADGEKLQLAIDGPAYSAAVKATLQAAHDAACVTVLTVCAEFNQAVYQTVIRNQLNDAVASMVMTLHQSGDTRRKKSAGVKGVTEAKRKIAAKLQATINALKTQGTVPATFPMEATLDGLKRIRDQVILSRSGGAVAVYDSMLDDGVQPVKHSEKVSLGRIGDWERLRSVALDHFADNVKIQMISTVKTIPDSAINGLNILSAQQSYNLPSGVKLTMTSYGYLTTLLDLHLAAQQKGTTLGARKVIDYAPEQMLNSLGEELSDLWMIADDVGNKVLLDAQ